MVLCNFSYDLDPEVKVQVQIMYFLVNALSLKPIDVTTLDFVPD